MNNFSENQKVKRSRLRNKLEVLKTLEANPQTVTQIADLLGTHFYTVKNVIVQLKRKGLVEKKDSLYMITDKGRDTIPTLEKIVDLDDQIRQMMRKIDI
jgi:predicted transcriptional regulator